MQQITVLCVGRLKEPYLTAACAEYQKRLQTLCRLQIVELPAQNCRTTRTTARSDRRSTKRAP